MDHKHDGAERPALVGKILDDQIDFRQVARLFLVAANLYFALQGTELMTRLLNR